MGRVIIGSDCYECRSVVVSDGVVVLDFGLSLHLGSEIIIQVLGEGLSCTTVRCTGRVYVSGCVYDVWGKTVYMCSGSKLLGTGRATKRYYVSKDKMNFDVGMYLDSLKHRRIAKRRIVRLEGSFDSILFNTEKLIDGEMKLSGKIGSLDADIIMVSGDSYNIKCDTVIMTK